jgi:hypothetical protein
MNWVQKCYYANSKGFYLCLGWPKDGIKILLIANFNTCYTWPFLNESGSALVCFHPNA